MNENMFERLKNFVFEQRWKYKFDLSRETQLQKDLGIYGDDAVEFIIAYGKTFDVDVSKFKAADYFDDEGGIKLPSFVKKAFGVSSSKKSLTLGDLEKGILAKILDEQVINLKS